MTGPIEAPWLNLDAIVTPGLHAALSEAATHAEAVLRVVATFRHRFECVNDVWTALTAAGAPPDVCQQVLDMTDANAVTERLALASVICNYVAGAGGDEYTQGYVKDLVERYSVETGGFDPEHPWQPWR